VRPVVSGQTWLALIHVLAGLFTGLAALVVVMTGLSLGIGLAVVWVGVPVLVGVYWFCRWFAGTERARYALLLGVVLPPPPRLPADGGWWRRARRALAAPSFYRALAYSLLRVPVSVMQLVLVTVAWSLALAMVTLPAYGWALPLGGAHTGSYVVRGPGVAAAVAAGVVLLLAAPWVTRVKAVSDVWLGRWLLSSGGRSELAARIGELETSRAAVVGAAEVERRRIERDLHDGAQQRLVSLAMELGRAKAKFATDPGAAEGIVSQAHEQAKEALAELRNLVRGVHPPVLTDRGLDAALSGLAALSPVPVTVRVNLPQRPPAQLEAIAYFVVAEALTNVAKHARASRAEVAVTRSGGLLTVMISDDGTGGADPGGEGLSGLAGRVAGVDGRLLITSPLGGPTTIEVALPCES
jgi:signal transduction histidine kinase